MILESVASRFESTLDRLAKVIWPGRRSGGARYEASARAVADSQETAVNIEDSKTEDREIISQRKSRISRRAFIAAGLAAPFLVRSALAQAAWPTRPEYARVISRSVVFQNPTAWALTHAK